MPFGKGTLCIDRSDGLQRHPGQIQALIGLVQPTCPLPQKQEGTKQEAVRVAVPLPMVGGGEGQTETMGNTQRLGPSALAALEGNLSAPASRHQGQRTPTQTTWRLSPGTIRQDRVRKHDKDSQRPGFLH